MTEASSPSPSSLNLSSPLQQLPGCDERTARCLRRLGLRRARDLLFHFPRDYQDPGVTSSLAELQEGQLCTVTAEVVEASLSEGGASSVFSALLYDGQEHLRCVWFNQPFHERRLRRGRRITATGKPRRRANRWEMSHPQYEIVEEAPAEVGLLPVYRLTEGLTQPRLRLLIGRALGALAGQLPDVLPASWREEKQLPGLAEALTGMHAPGDQEQLQAARRRLAYQELLVLQIALALRQSVSRSQAAWPFPATSRIDARIKRLFPFPLTPDQQQAMREVAEDMAREQPMNRLLQGDVGAGKTVVAIYAMLLTVAHGGQAILMTPTEVLARQHMRTLEKRLRGSRVRMGLLTGSLADKARRELVDQAAAGEIDLIVGTQAILHALGQDGDLLPKLGLVIIDEQHKFGVRQRARLRSTGKAPHYLVMTATPIPRTVAMTLFGDLEVSTLREGPAGRPPLHTYRVSREKRDAWWTFVARKLREGRQGYVVAPQVSATTEPAAKDLDAMESDEADFAAGDAWDGSLPASAADEPSAEDREAAETANVESLFEELTAGPLREFRVEMVHGGLAAADKDAAMQRFERGETQVLVASAVVEVGLDVPNATLMTIESAERFGLAALHQLRGRVARGVHPGYVALLDNAATELSRQRLDALLRSADGFQLAELDYQLRGPGDLFGVRQHGLPPMRVADLQRDAEWLREAYEDARRLLEITDAFQDAEWAGLREMALRRYGQALDLGDLG